MQSNTAQTNVIQQRNKSGAFCAPHVFPTVFRLLSGFLALCMLWSFAAAPTAIAASLDGPQSLKPHSQWMPSAMIKKIKARTQHAAAMQHRAQKPGFPYRLAMAHRALRIPNRVTGSTASVTAAPPTLLDEVGRLNHPVSPAQAAGWSRELASHPASARAAVLHVWLGEWQLAANQQPLTADQHFRAAQHLLTPTQSLYGLAAYNRAVGLFYEGAYAESVNSFHHLLVAQPHLFGFDRRNAALWMRHAGACAGYHNDRALIGIPEPPRLDPLCGVAALAASVQALGGPGDRKTIVAATHVTGEGSSLQDLVTGGLRLGYSARVVRADDQGLRMLPKPLVAYVEHDHFVAVMRADAKGVSYLCSDCGPWPGGRVDLTWNQWHMLNGGLYAVITQPGSTSDQLLSALESRTGPASPTTVEIFGDSPSAESRLSSVLETHPFGPLAWAASPALPVVTVPVRLAYAGSLTDLQLSFRTQAYTFDAAFKPFRSQPPSQSQLQTAGIHIALDQQSNPAFCGSKVYTTQCDCPTCCQSAGGGPNGSSGQDSGQGSNSHQSITAPGPTDGDPVNLATGEEDYTPKPDLEVYNPHGPSVVWSRRYESLRRPGQGFTGDTLGDAYYEMNDFGEGWSRSYNIGVFDPTNGAVGSSNLHYIFFENGSRTAFWASAVPTASTPQVQCTLNQAGEPFLVYWNYASTGNYYTIVFSDRIQWVTTAAVIIPTGNSTTQWVYPLSQLIDRTSHAITFNYGPAAGGTYAWPLLSSITNQDGTALLTIVRVGDGTGNIAEVQDCYGRSVLYHVSAYAAVDSGGIGYAELDHVSQITPVGTPNPADRYVYGYINVDASGSFSSDPYAYPFLHRISVPNPTGSATPSTATINYDQNTEFVSTITDQNGNTTTFTSVTASGFGTPGSTGGPTAGSTLSTTSSYPSNYTQVEVSGNGASYTYVGGYDNNMSGALMTDGANRVTMTKTFNATSADPLRPTSESDANGNVTQYVWDQWGNLHQSTSPRGVITNYTWALPTGQVPSVINSVAASGAGFGLGEQVTVQQSISGSAKTATQYTYFEPSGLVASINSPLPGTVGAALPTTPTYAYQYDTYGDLTSTVTRGNNAASTITTTYNYTSDPGNSTYGIAAYSQAAAIAEPLTITDNLGHVMHKRYDSQANTIAQIDALGNETDRIYYNPSDPTTYSVVQGVKQSLDNQLRTVSYPATGQTGAGRASDVSTYLYINGPILLDAKYDESGNQVRQAQFTYGPEGELLSEVGDKQTQYITYDGLYRPATFSDGDVQATQYTYNQYGYLATQTEANGDEIQFTSYDTKGNLLTRIDPRGVETDYVYNDPESKLTDMKYPATPSLNVHFTYDGYGRKSGMTDSVGAYVYAYDDLNKQTSVQTTYTGLVAKTISYGYYPDGSIQSMTTPASATAFQYTYDAAGRPATLTNPFGETSSWTIGDNNWLAASNSGGVLTTAYTRNARGETTDLANKKTDANTTLLSEFSSIQFDAVGNVSSVAANYPTATSYNGTTTYAYDAKNELTSEQDTGAGNYSNSYGYDPAGNATTFKGVTHTYNTANQDKAYTYDQSGNPTSYKGTTIAYDAENRLTTYNGTTLTNGYRGDSLRAWKQNSGGKTYFLYAGSQPVCELGSTGSVTATNTFGPSGPISRHTSSGSVFYAFDYRNSVAQRLNSSGTVLSSQTFDAYGTRLSTDGNSDPYAGFGGQAGYYTDWETGTAASALELLTFRYYDPAAGRFLNRDPIGHKGGANEYEYVNNGPTGATDPSGLDPISSLLGIIGAGIGACIGAYGGSAIGTNNDSCYANYNQCLELNECLADATSAIAGASLLILCPETLLASFLIGCFEGCLSAILHAASEQECAEVNPCHPPDASPLCQNGSAIFDAVSGCIDGVLGTCVGEGVSEIVFDTLSEFVAALFGNAGEASNCSTWD